MNIIQDFIPAGRGNRPAKYNPCLYITIHNTGNTGSGSGAKNHANYLKGDDAAKNSVSWHYTVDDAVAYQHLPDEETAYHAGDGANGTGNAKSIGIEICMNSDGNLLLATDNAAELTALLCKRHNIPVEKIVQHNNWTGKNCPQMLRAGKPYTWDAFIIKVKAWLGSPGGEGTPLICAPDATVKQAEQWAKDKGATDTIVSLAKKYWDYCGTHGGVNPLAAYCQAVFETGYGKFGGVIDESFHNPCGMKTTEGGSDTDKEAHQRFISWEDGVKAHLDHLALYAGAAGYPRANSPDPRHFPYLLGKGDTIESMSKQWCPGNPSYASKIIGMMSAAENTQAPEKTPEEITVDNAIADGVLIDRSYWLGVLGGTVSPKPEYVKTVLDRYHAKLI